MRNLAFLTLLSLPLARLCLGAPPDNVLEAVGRIKTEAFDHSHVMESLGMMTDRFGPRLTASPEFDEAAEWAMRSMREMGLQNVHSEKWGPFGRSWSLESYTLDMVTPRYSHLVAVPLAWSSPSKLAQAEAVYAPLRVQNRYDIAATREAFDKYKKEWSGKLKGRIVMDSESTPMKPPAKSLFERYTEAELTEISQAPAPSMKRDVSPEHLHFPSDREEAIRMMRSLPEATLDAMFEKRKQLNLERAKFYREEGAVALISGDSRAEEGLIFAEAAGSEKAADPLALPTFVVTAEQYSRMVRLLEHNEKVALRYGVEAKYSDGDKEAQNLVGEIPGRTKTNEIVMIGAHFDSWHSGTGATDNGAGSAVMMEVMRVLKQLDLPLDRTVRVALWSGEEQGLYGSKAYVKEHFGDPKTMELKPEHASLDAYLNLDNGSGKIRGVYLQGNDAARPLFANYMHPFADMGASTISLRNTGGTDHLSFDAVGLPGFQFIQDPLDYSTVTHHSDMDTFSHAVPEDLMQASAIIATMVYDIANAPERFPRKALPQVKPRTAPPKATE